MSLLRISQPATPSMMPPLSNIVLPLTSVVRPASPATARVNLRSRTIRTQRRRLFQTMAMGTHKKRSSLKLRPQGSAVEKIRCSLRLFRYDRIFGQFSMCGAEGQKYSLDSHDLTTQSHGTYQIVEAGTTDSRIDSALFAIRSYARRNFIPHGGIYKM